MTLAEVQEGNSKQKCLLKTKLQRAHVVTSPTFHWPQESSCSNPTTLPLVGGIAKSRGKGYGYKATEIGANKSTYQTSPRIVLTSHHVNSVWLFPKYTCSTLNTSGFLSLPDWAAFFWWQRSTSNDFSSSDSGFLPQKNVWDSGLHESLKFTT